MEQHKVNINLRCRVCGRKATTRKHSKSSDPCKSVLSSVYGLDVAMESGDIFPPDVCNSCFLALRRAKNDSDSRPTMTISSWTPHSDSCQVCLEDHGGRPRKRKRGRPSDDSNPCIPKKLMLSINSINTPEYAGFPLVKSFFLPSPYLEDLICQRCKCIPSKPVEILTCRHLMCASCLSTTGVVACPCCSIPLSCSDLSIPSHIVLNLISSLLIRSNQNCDEVMALKDLHKYVQSQCTQTEVPPTSIITVEQLLVQDTGETVTLMKKHTMGLVAEMFPKGGYTTLKSSTGQVKQQGC